MSQGFQLLEAELNQRPRQWLVTGAAGFIGSHLVEKLLKLNQKVSGIDNFSTGLKENFDKVRQIVGDESWKNFRFLEGDVSDPQAVRTAIEGCEVVLHQAALGSVPRSIEDPLATNRANVEGFLVTAKAAADAAVKRFVYASSSSVYGTSKAQVKKESELGSPLSPYAASKRANEIYADSFSASYGLSSIGLRYFNVFGARQNPEGPYAAVIPRWLDAFRRGEPGVIFGDGETTRDFCYISNVVQANLLAACAPETGANTVYNIAVGDTTSLNKLYQLLAQELLKRGVLGKYPDPRYEAFRKGDVRDSLADVSKAQSGLGYVPSFRLPEGIEALIAAEFGPEGSK